MRPQQSLLNIANVFGKLDCVERIDFADTDLKRLETGAVPEVPARDIRVLNACDMPPRKGLSQKEGQARLLHDLANIELQAVELCYRGLLDFPDADSNFREELYRLLKDEGRHLSLCLQALEDLGFRWGDFPVHLGLWHAVRSGDDLLNRILIVHRYLEGNGLDAGDTLLRKLHGVPEARVHMVVGEIARDELGHVAFGSRWFKYLCEKENLDPDQEFKRRFAMIETQIPRRIEKINWELRKCAGYSDEELRFLEERRNAWVKFPPSRPVPTAASNPQA